MAAGCNQFVVKFHPVRPREIRVRFDGGAITSQGGGLLLREVERRIRILRHPPLGMFVESLEPSQDAWAGKNADGGVTSDIVTSADTL
jgi:hypothetical protein